MPKKVTLTAKKLTPGFNKKEKKKMKISWLSQYRCQVKIKTFGH